MVNTFLPEPDIERSLRVLDYRRLGKQRVETKQILRALRGETRGWIGHPAARMWRNYEASLCRYGLVCCLVWIDHGYNDSLLPYFLATLSEYDSFELPPWFGDEEFHRSHQSNLVRKFPEHYRQFYPDVPNNLEYVWPT